MSGKILILGATSAIARASAAVFAKNDYEIYLAARDSEELARIASDLHICYGVRIVFGEFDAEAYDTHGAFIDSVIREMGGLDGVLLAFGYLGDQLEARNFAAGSRVLARNYTGAVSVLSHCADYFSKKRSGFIIGISSVAGDRGRQSNYVYGSAKAGLSIYLQGLRNRLFPDGVRVITVKPGFVDTAMTFGLPGLFLVESPQYVAARIYEALIKSRDIIYVPWFWKYIMQIIRIVPETIFKRLKL